MPTQETEAARETDAPEPTPNTEPAIDAGANANVDAAAEPDVDPAARAEADRKRLEEQLAMLEKKQAEVRRALAIADHPEIGEAIREIEGRIYRASKAETRLANPLSKSEARQREKLEKKLEVARAKRAELDATIAALETEAQALGEGRMEGLRAEHDGAVRALFTSLARHAEAFEAAGLQAANLIPELSRWLPTLRTLADAHTEAQGEPAEA